MCSKEFKLLREISDLVNDLLHEMEVDENDKTIFLSQEVLEKLWDADRQYSQFLEQGGAIQ